MTDPKCLWYRETHRHGANHVLGCKCGDDWTLFCDQWGRIAARYQYYDLDVHIGKLYHCGACGSRTRNHDCTGEP